MLAIRMQRTGRSGHASFKVVVQDSRKSPLSGKIVAYIGNYDPHTKATVIAKDKAEFYLTHGAHPSERVAVLLKKEGVKLPAWVLKSTKKSKTIRHPEKLRRNRPNEPKPAIVNPEPAEAADEPVEAIPEAVDSAPAPAEPTENTDTASLEEPETPVEPETAAAEPAEPPADTKAEVTGEDPPESPEAAAKSDE